MPVPTMEELREIDKQLPSSLTMDGIRKHDARYRLHNNQPNEWDDAEAINCSEIAGYTVRDIRRAAKLVLTGRKLECFLWMVCNPGITYAEVALEVGISKSSVRTYLARAIRQVLTVPDLGLWEVLLDVFGSRILCLAGYDKK